MLRETRPEALRRVASTKTNATLVAMMEEVVRIGTARAAAIPGVTVAGKTGTAEKIVNGSYSAGNYIASFVGVAPAAEPRLVVLVALDEPSTGIFYGGLVAAPVVKRILEASLPLLGVAGQGRLLGVTIRDHYPTANADPGADFARASLVHR